MFDHSIEHRLFPIQFSLHLLPHPFASTASSSPQPLQRRCRREPHYNNDSYLKRGCNTPHNRSKPPFPHLNPFLHRLQHLFLSHCCKYAVSSFILPIPYYQATTSHLQSPLTCFFFRHIVNTTSAVHLILVSCTASVPSP